MFGFMNSTYTATNVCRNWAYLGMEFPFPILLVLSFLIQLLRINVFLQFQLGFIVTS
jgi:hypothetical protein